MFSNQSGIFFIAFLVLHCQVKAEQSTSFVTEPLCLLQQEPVPANHLKLDLKCESGNYRQHGLFIRSVEYSSNNNDYNICPHFLLEDDNNNIKKKNCSAFPTHKLSNKCNGKSSCSVELEPVSFKLGFDGANCEHFEARVVQISYECVPVNFEDNSIPRYDVCGKPDPISHPVHGFIHSSHYPRSYENGKFCSITLPFVDKVDDRIELYLIKLRTEGLSMGLSAQITDYLQIDDSGEKLFGNQDNLMFDYKKNANVVVKFNADNYFRYQGFFLYFKVVKKPITITTTTTTTTTTIPTTTTITTATTRISSFSNEKTNETNQLPEEASVNYYDDSNGRVKAILLKSPTARMLSPTTSSSTSSSSSSASVSPQTLQTILVLMGLIILLSAVIVGLALSARKRLSTETDRYKQAIQFHRSSYSAPYLDNSQSGSGYYPTVIFQQQEATEQGNLNNPTNIVRDKKRSSLRRANQQFMVHFNKLSQQMFQRANVRYDNNSNTNNNIGNSSTSQLMMNASGLMNQSSRSNSAELPSQTVQPKSNEEYVYVIDPVEEETEEIESKTTTTHPNANEYTYVTGQTVVNLVDTSNDADKPSSSSNRNSSSSTSSSSSSSSCSQIIRTTGSGGGEEDNDSENYLIAPSTTNQSTPCVPKTLPPTLLNEETTHTDKETKKENEEKTASTTATAEAKKISNDYGLLTSKKARFGSAYELFPENETTVTTVSASTAVRTNVKPEIINAADKTEKQETKAETDAGKAQNKNEEEGEEELYDGSYQVPSNLPSK